MIISLCIALSILLCILLFGKKGLSLLIYTTLAIVVNPYVIFGLVILYNFVDKISQHKGG